MRTQERNLLSVAVVVAVHVALLTYMGRSLAAPPPPEADTAIDVSLLDGAGMSMPGAALRAPAATAAPSVASAASTPSEIPDPVSEPTPPSVLELAARIIAAASPALDLSAELSTEPEIVTSMAPTAEALAEALATQNAALAAAGGDTCEITGALQAALQNSDGVLQALAQIPPASRSVANAVLLWNGAWAGDAPLVPLREAVRAGVLAEPPDCLDRLVQGPRFISLATASGTAVVVLGSGVWRWSDLLTGAGAAPPK